VDEARFLVPLRPGSRLHMDISVPGWRDDGAIVEGVVSDGRQTVATVRRCVLAFVPLADYYDPTTCAYGIRKSSGRRQKKARRGTEEVSPVQLTIIKNCWRKPPPSP